uniref:Costars domain-containing protein n=1 Tax=Parastrongyloides trichosuri TaxID=131310 RepID=A0A0N4ZEI8_PARTI
MSIAHSQPNIRWIFQEMIGIGVGLFFFVDSTLIMLFCSIQWGHFAWICSTITSSICTVLLAVDFYVMSKKHHENPEITTTDSLAIKFEKEKPLIGVEKEIENKWKEIKKKRSRKSNDVIKRGNNKLRRIISDVEINNESNKEIPKKNENKLLNKSNSISDVMDKFKNLEIKEKESSIRDVYSSNYKPIKLSKNDPEYGTPIPGTLTEMRAKKASKHIAKEMGIMCQVIEEYGTFNKSIGQIQITFGELFNVYTYISDKVVGILLRARKHNMVHFDGEMLFQRRDEDKVITLLLDHDEIINAIKNA